MDDTRAHLEGLSEEGGFLPLDKFTQLCRLSAVAETVADVMRLQVLAYQEGATIKQVTAAANWSSGKNPGPFARAARFHAEWPAATALPEMLAALEREGLSPTFAVLESL